MAGNNFDVDDFENINQSLFTQGFRFFLAIAGSIGVIGLVFAGIHFSQVIFSYLMGSDEMAMYISYALSIVISAFELAGVTLFGGNKNRDLAIKFNNRLEYTLAKYFTIGIFIFDVLSNFFGLYMNMQTNKLEITVPRIILLICVSIVFGGSEVLASFMFRFLAVSYTGWIVAKKKSDAYHDKLDEETLRNIKNQGNGGGSGNYNSYTPPSQPKQNTYIPNHKPQNDNNQKKDQSRNKQELPTRLAENLMSFSGKDKNDNMYNEFKEQYR